MDSVGAFDGTGGAIAAAHIANFFPKISEIDDRLMVVAAEIHISKEAQYIRHRHALGALPLAFLAHTAVVGPDLFIH